MRSSAGARAPPYPAARTAAAHDAGERLRAGRDGPVPSLAQGSRFFSAQSRRTQHLDATPGPAGRGHQPQHDRAVAEGDPVGGRGALPAGSRSPMSDPAASAPHRS